MKCKRCGTINAAENKYCTNCGNELPKENQVQKNICDSCGSENNLTNKFCTDCGEKLRIHGKVNAEPAEQDNRHKNKENQIKNKNNKHSSFEIKSKKASIGVGFKPLLTTIVVLLAVIIVIAIMNNWSDKDENAQSPREAKSSNPVVDLAVFDIASKFVCSCGKCGEISLEKCKCPTAIEERQFVRDYFERKKKPEEIVVALANRYGYLKAEYAKEFNVDNSNTWSSTK